MTRDCGYTAHGNCWGSSMPCHGYVHKNYDGDDQSCYHFAFSGGAPRISCRTTKECVKTYKTYYKMYKICTFRLYKVCTRCGLEFDYYGCRGMCPRCR
jgi:hypothetical protein